MRGNRRSSSKVYALERNIGSHIFVPGPAECKENTSVHWTILDPSSRLIKLWDSIQLIMIVYITIGTPYIIAFLDAAVRLVCESADAAGI